MATRYLTAYSYGQGAVWTFVVAESADEIREKYPDLELFAEPPPWMKAETLGWFTTVDVNDADDPFLAALRAQSGG